MTGAPTADEANASVPLAAEPAVGLRRHRARRWARRHLDVVVEHQADRHAPPAPCAGCHPGRHDYWGACSGMSLTVAGREALAAEHPWRATA